MSGADYWRYFTHGGTGQRVLGQMQGNGGVAVGISTIRRQQELLRREGHVQRFFAPQPEHVRIYLPGRKDLAHDDPAGWVDWPLAALRVDCRACADLRTKWTVCVDCQRQRVGDAATGAWLPAPVGGYPVDTLDVTHGFCPSCFRARYGYDVSELKAEEA